MNTKDRDEQFLQRMQQIARKAFTGNLRIYDVKHFTATGYDHAREAADLGMEAQKDHDEYLIEQGLTP